MRSVHVFLSRAEDINGEVVVGRYISDNFGHHYIRTRDGYTVKVVPGTVKTIYCRPVRGNWSESI